MNLSTINIGVEVCKEKRKVEWNPQAPSQLAVSSYIGGVISAALEPNHNNYVSCLCSWERVFLHCHLISSICCFILSQCTASYIATFTSATKFVDS